jgi:hypothetical protein
MMNIIRRRLMHPRASAFSQNALGRRALAWLPVLFVPALTLGFAMNAQAAPPVKASDVYSEIKIFPENYDLEPYPRLSCVRDRAALNSLTCTANDVSLANITLPAGAPSTCKGGEVVTTKLNFDVHSTASTRYNWGFYTTLDPNATPLEGPGDACLIWVGEIQDFDPSVSNSQSANGDLCTDVTKSQDAYFENQTLSFICRDTDGDTQVDLDYCATWDQNDDALCNSNGEIDPALLPVPGAPSKCNCASVTVPITVLPEAPALVKSGTPTHTEKEVYEGTDRFEFDLKITNNNTNTTIAVTAINESFGGIPFVIDENTVYGSSTTSLAENDVRLVSANDGSGTCLADGPEIIAPGAIYTCTVTFRWKSLQLFDTDTSDAIVREDKSNNFSVEWAYVTDDTTKPPTLATSETEGPSNDATASITDVPPVLTIDKTANKSSIPETGSTNFDKVDYTVTFGSTSGWDTIDITTGDLTDQLLQNGANATTGYLTGCIISDLDKGETRECYYSVNLATVYPTLDTGDVYKNTAWATPTDEEGTQGSQVDDFASVQVNNVNPTVTLKKYVKAGQSTSTTIADYDDSSTSVDEYQLDDLTNAPIATYLFVVSNNSFESFTIDGFVDFAAAPYSLTPPSQSYDANIADTTPVAGDCSSLVGTTVDPLGDARCTLSFKVKGDESDSVDNTAWVRVSDSDGETCIVSGCFDTDDAMVDFDPADFGINLGIDLEAIIEVTVKAGSNNRELVSFNPVADFVINDGSDDVAILDLSADLTNFTFTVENVDCYDGTQELGPDEESSCSFKVMPKGSYAAATGLAVIEDALEVKVQDDDGIEHSLSSTITVKAGPSVAP